jgi:formylmethanofuran dehydrogenase subunit E
MQKIDTKNIPLSTQIVRAVVNDKRRIRVYVDQERVGEFDTIQEAIKYMIEAKTKAKEMVEYYMKNTSFKISDDSRIEWPTAKLFATKEIQSMLGVAFTFTGKQADEMYEYLHRVRQEIDNL